MPNFPAIHFANANSFTTIFYIAITYVKLATLDGGGQRRESKSHLGWLTKDLKSWYRTLAIFVPVSKIKTVSLQSSPLLRTYIINLSPMMIFGAIFRTNDDITNIWNVENDLSKCTFRRWLNGIFSHWTFDDICHEYFEFTRYLVYT